MHYRRTPIEIESPEEMGYGAIEYNLAESSARDLPFKELGVDLSEVILAYGEHRGALALRELIVADSQNLYPDDVLTTTGAVMALFLVATTLLDKKDHVVVIRPNYATNVETPRSIGCESSIIDLNFDNGYELDVEKIRAALRSNTRLISITNPHNPTGKIFPASSITALVKIAEEHRCYLLVDETYRDLNFQTALAPYAAEASAKVISICSFSKAYGAPGIRVGWAVCRDRKLMHDLLAAKEQIVLGNGIIEEEIARHLLANKNAFLEPIHQHIRKNFQIFKGWIAGQNLLEWNEPQAGVVAFVRLKESYALDAPGFSKALFEDYKTVVGHGRWFEQPDHYFRIGFGYPETENMREGLKRFLECLQKFII